MAGRISSELENLLNVVVFFVLLSIGLLAVSVTYRFIIAPMFALVGLFTYRLLYPQRGEDSDSHKGGFRHSNLVLATLHVSVIAFWLFVSPSPSLFFQDWVQLPVLLILRGIISIVYVALVPGLLLARLLDTKLQLSRLEIAVLGFLLSIFIASTFAYSLVAVGYDLNAYLFPLLWVVTTLLLIASIIANLRKIAPILCLRPSSFPTMNSRNLLLVILAFLSVCILSINVAWRTLLGGDLWTHAAQTSYFLQGQATGLYPWTFHFLAASIHAVSGLPVVNSIQLLQVFGIMPVLALYVTVEALAGKIDSRISALSTLFFTVFMGLGWSSYFYLSASNHLVGSGAIYGGEFIASELTFDIMLGVAGYRVAMVPATIALTALIFSVRLLDGYYLPKRLLITTSFVLVALMIQSHLFEAGFFTAILVAANLFLWDKDNRRVLSIISLCTTGAFVWAYAVDYLSPPTLQILSSFQGNFYYSGFEYALLPLAVALAIIGIQIPITKRTESSFDLIETVLKPVETVFGNFESSLLKISIIVCVGLGVTIGLITLLNAPFFAWQTTETGDVPWNYYPIRLGVVTLFAVLGIAIILLHRGHLRRIFPFFALAAVAIIVGRLTYLFGLRPQGFGENRVMDFLWIGVVVIAAYGFLHATPLFLKWLSSGRARQQVIGAFLIILIVATGATSFLLFVDAYVENSMTPGLVPTAADMVVISYIITHRDSVGFILTAPTFETQYFVRKLTLDQPFGYRTPFVTPSIFTSTTGIGFLDQMSTYASLRIILTNHDISYLAEHEYKLSLWYLAYQSPIVDSGTSFLLAPVALRSPNGGSIAALTNQTGTQADFLLLSALGLANTPYSVGSLRNPIPASSPYVILGDDPSNKTAYQSALSWVQATGNTLVVISNADKPGLFESVFFGDRELSSTFPTSSITRSDGSINYELPVPFMSHVRSAQNGTVLSYFQGANISSPLSYERPFGGGKIVLVMLRDFYQFLLNGMFTQLGRESYRFLPFILQASGVPLTPQ